MDFFLSDSRRVSSFVSRRPASLPLVGSLLVALILGQCIWSGRSLAGSLEAGIPPESILFLHWQNAKDSGFASTYLGHLQEKIARSGFLDTFFRHLEETFPPASRKAFTSHIKRWRGIVSSLPWWHLVSSEVAIGGRVGARGAFEFILLFRREKEQIAAELLGLRDLLYAYSSLGEEYELEVGIRNGAATTVLQNGLDLLDQIAVSAQGDVIGISTSAALLRRSFQLLSGETLSPGFTRTPGYEQLQSKMKKRIGKRPPAGKETARFEFIFQPRGVLKDVVILDVIEEYHYLASFTPAGAESSSRTVLSEAIGNPLIKAVTGQPSVEGLAAGISADAVSYSATSGTDPAGVYEFCMELLVNITGNAESAERFEREQARLGIRLRREILQNLTGRRVTAVFPPSPDARPSRAFLFEVKDADRASSAIAGAVEALAGPLREWNLELGSKTEDGAREGFHVFSSGLLGFDISFGVRGNFLALATSREAFRKVAATLEGKSASLADARSLKWLPKSDLAVDSFYKGVGSGLSDPGDWLLKLGGLLGTLLPDPREPAILKPFLISLPRLEGALRSLDVFSESSGYSLRDGNVFFSTASSKLRPVAGF